MYYWARLAGQPVSLNADRSVEVAEKISSYGYPKPAG